MQIHKYQNDFLDSSLDLYINIFSRPPWNDKWPSYEHMKGYIQDIINTPGFLGICAFDDSKQIGLILGNIKKWCSGDEYWIHEFCIANEYQRKNIGTQMLSYLKEELIKAKIFRITLLTIKDAPAVAFYQKNDFNLNQRMCLMSHRIENKGML